MRTYDLAAEYYDEACRLRHMIHRHPEVGHREYQTTALIRTTLESYGVETVDCGLSTGALAVIKGARPGKVVALREDIDALPIEEKTGLSFASQTDGICHACGHDIHTAALLICAKILSACREQLCGDVLLVFQCSEETGDGAAEMLAHGIFDRYKPNVLLGLHCAPSLPAGTVGICEGTANASSDTISVRVIGKGGHGAHPEDCVDPLTIGAGLLMQLQTIISRRNKATDPAVLTFGEIHGGTAPNVIPSSLDMYGTLRTFDNDVMRRHLNAIRSMCAGYCRSLGGDCEVAVSKSMPPLINSPDVCRLLRTSAASVLGAENVRTDIPPSMGSDDFSCLLEACGNNGAQFLLGTALAGVPQSAVGLHAAENIFPDEALTPAAAVLAQFALDYLRA